MWRIFQDNIMRRIGSFTKNQLKYIFAGLVTWLPVGIVLFVIIYITGLLEGLGESFFDVFMEKETIPPGLGFIFWIVVFYITGLIFNRTSVSQILARIPLLGMFFGKGGEAMTLDKLAKLTPCVFLYSPTCISFGWILWEQGVKVNNENSTSSILTVYYPNVPTIVSGQVYVVRKEAVIKLKNSTQELINILLYGLKKPESLKYVPWDGESEQEFRERALRFGVPLKQWGDTDISFVNR